MKDQVERLSNPNGCLAIKDLKEEGNKERITFR